MPNQAPKRKARQMIAIPDKNLYERAKAKASEKGKTLQDYVNETMLMNIEKDEYIKRSLPNFSVTVGEHSLYIYDAKKKRSAEVILAEDQLVCFEDASNDCEHINFVRLLPEMGLLPLKTREYIDKMQQNPKLMMDLFEKTRKMQKQNKDKEAA